MHHTHLRAHAPILRRMAACLLALAWVSPAWADRPLVSETADVIDAGACQLEAWTARARQAGAAGERDHSAVFSCGVGGQHQFALGGSRTRSDGSSLRSVMLGGKTTLRMPDKGAPGFGVAYALSFDKGAGQGLRREGASLLGAATQALGDGYLVHANLGWVHSRSARQSSTLWSLGVERGEDWVWSADVFGDDRSRPWVAAGAGWALLQKFSFNAAYALQFERKRVKQFSVGVKLQF